MAGRINRQKWVDLCRSYPRIVLVKSDANDWSGRMQMGGQVRAITQLDQRGIDHWVNSASAPTPTSV